jgi:hypothetical protein
VNAGGEYHSNTLTVSGGYSMSFFPVLDRFEKVLSAQVTIQLPNGFKLTGGTVSTPDGRTRWTAYGNKYARGPLSDAELGHEAPVSGKYSFTGTAVDGDGKPVAGVAITIGKGEVFTDSHGRFLMPSRKKKSQPLAVVPADFMAAGKWNVVSAPSTIAPEVPVTVVVARIVR